MITAVKQNRPARIALLGCGTVGREVAGHLLSGRLGGGAALAKVLVRDAVRPRGFAAHERGLFTESFDDVLAAEPDVVVELLGGLDPAAGYIGRALAQGIPVVTANKTVIAHRGGELMETARRSGGALAFEASVCAGVPVLAALAQLRGDHILGIRGIVSGSCNFILGRLGAGVAMDRAIAEAQARGLVEPDPSADISGRDCAEKACILAAAAGYPGFTPAEVALEGIGGIDAEDLAAARRTGHTIKLLVELGFEGGAPRLRAGPTLVPLAHPLAGINGEENGVVITAALAGEVSLRGRGAGPAPTASAVLGDVARLLAGFGHPGPAPGAAPGAVVTGHPEEGTPRAADRQHLVRAAAASGGLDPARVFAELDRHGVAATEVAVSRSGAHLLVRGQSDAAARRLAISLAQGESGRALVVPSLG